MVGKLAALAATVVLAGGTASAAVALNKPQNFSLLDVSLAETALPPGSFNPESDSPTPVGGRLAFTDALYKWAGLKRGARVGRLEGLCTATKLDLAARSETSFCNATAFLPCGEILLAGHITFSEKGPGYFLIVVTGGTGSYAGARGFVKARDIGGFKTSLDFHLLP